MDNLVIISKLPSNNHLLLSMSKWSNVFIIFLLGQHCKNPKDFSEEILKSLSSGYQDLCSLHLVALLYNAATICRTFSYCSFYNKAKK